MCSTSLCSIICLVSIEIWNHGTWTGHITLIHYFSTPKQSFFETLVSNQDQQEGYKWIKVYFGGCFGVKVKTKRLSIERGYRQTTPELECTMWCCVTKRFMKWRVLMRLSCVQQTTKESNNWFYTISLLCLPLTNSLVFFITCQRFILWKRVFSLGTTSWKVLS